MGKKKLRKTATSRGQRDNISSSVLKMVKRETNEVDRVLNKVAAWRAGKNPWVSVPSKLDKRQPYVRVRANTHWGNPKFLLPNIYRGKMGEE